VPSPPGLRLKSLPARCCSCRRTSPEHPCGRGMHRAWWRPSSMSRPYIVPLRPQERPPAALPEPGQPPRSVHQRKAK
jgi:hypothetical protein